MQGKKTPVEVIEEVKALSLVYSPKAICKKVNLGLRTVYNILARKDSPAVEAKREEMRVDVVERMWKNKDQEILQLKDRMDMLLDGVSQERVEKARLMEVTTAYGILFDKRQLLMGKPTQNIFSLTAILEQNEASRRSSRSDNAQGQEAT